MQIVIDIPERIYYGIEKGITVNGSSASQIVLDAVKSGTPLPKGHGDLIDVGQCDRKLFYQQCGGANSFITVKSAFDMLMSLPTILEADKAESEEV